MKKIFELLLCFVFLFSLTGCQSDSTEEEKKAKAKEKNYYETMEEIVLTNSQHYFVTNNKEVASMDELVNTGYINKEFLKDYEIDSYCDGYVVNKEEKKVYIKCKNYVTDGFDSSLLNK